MLYYTAKKLDVQVLFFMEYVLLRYMKNHKSYGKDCNSYEKNNNKYIKIFEFSAFFDATYSMHAKCYGIC